MAISRSVLCVLLILGAAVVSAQVPTDQPTRGAAAPSAGGVVPPSDYVIGPEDVLNIVFWRDKDMSAEVVVRPDGMITVPLVNDVQAAGLTPSEVRDRLTRAASRYIEEPNVTVIVRQINSRKIFVTGEVAKPGPYPLTGPATVLQMIAMAGGLKEYADGKNILVMRNERDHVVTYFFNYKDVSKRKNLAQNLELKPGDTIVVP